MTTAPEALTAAFDLDALRKALGEISGPAIVVGNAGEVNTGAFDDLTGLAAHRSADSPRFARLARGIELDDPVGADAHKWLNVS